MCFPDSAKPPAPPISGPVGEHGRTVITSADGTRVGAYQASPAERAGQAVLILPDARGLHPFYHHLAIRWAEAGRHALAIDYFARTAGIGDRGEDFPYREHIRPDLAATCARDASAGIAWLRANTAATSVFVLGFCIGGALSWRQTTTGDDLAGSIGFYGLPSQAADVTDRIGAPLLVLAAGQDFTPLPETKAFAAAVHEQSGVEVDVHVYPDAPHSFFDQGFDQHREACSDAWARQLAFLDRWAVSAR